MFGGPLLARELVTQPRWPRHFELRTGYVLALCIVIYTGAQATFGLAPARNAGDIASFGATILSLISFVQLALVIAAGLLFSAGSIAQEKDRRTLILLLMTDLRARELVLGKGLASILPAAVLILVSFPVFCLIRLLGGVTLQQIVWIEVICFVSLLAASAWGTLVGYWREKTFQIISISLLGAGLFLGLTEVIGAVAGPDSWLGHLAVSCDPFRALADIVRPFASYPDAVVPPIQAWNTVLVLGLMSIVLWTYTALRVRVWNPSRQMYLTPKEEHAADSEAAGTVRPPREVWTAPIIWREICTQAYGRKVGLIKFGYYVFALLCVLWLSRVSPDAPLLFGALPAEGLAFVMLALVSLILVNAQAVTALTSERDGQTLELLLVTEVTPREFVFGKLGGILFNSKEVLAVPVLFLLLTFLRGHLPLESFLFTLLAYLVLVIFVSVLGLHAGLSYHSSRTAIVNSLGTVFFLFVGIFVCLMLIVEARTSFMLQLVPFLVFILGGSLGLWRSLTYHNPSPALTMCAWGLPFLTFYALISFLLGDTAAVFAAVVVAYGFTTVAMLVPAVSAFDVALGRSTPDRG